MKKLLIVALLVLVKAETLGQSGGSTPSVTASALKNGTPLPATCRVGQVFVDTTASPAITYVCLTTNVFSAVTTGASFSCAGCTVNTIPKTSGVGALADGSLSDTGGTLVKPVVDNTVGLGDVTHRFTGLFLASGLPVNQGGTGAATLGANGVVIGEGTGAVNVTSAGTAGQILTSNGAGVDPTFQAAAAGGLVNPPTVDNTIAIGDLTHRFTNLFLGGVIKWTNGAGTADLGLSRDINAGNTLDLGTGAAQNSTAQLNLAIINNPNGALDIFGTNSSGFRATSTGGGTMDLQGNGFIRWGNGNGSFNSPDVSLVRLSANTLAVNTGSFPGSAGNLTATNLTATGAESAATHATATNCASTASPAVCGSASAGAVVIAASGTSVTVNTTAVTANSRIFIQEDQSLGTELSVTCNAGLLVSPASVSAKVAATSFTITISAGLAVNPVCFTYFIVN